MHGLAVPAIVVCLMVSTVLQPADERFRSHERRAQAADRHLVPFTWRSRELAAHGACRDGLMGIHGAVAPGAAPAAQVGLRPHVDDCGSAPVERAGARGLVVERAAGTRAPPAA